MSTICLHLFSVLFPAKKIYRFIESCERSGSLYVRNKSCTRTSPLIIILSFKTYSDVCYIGDGINMLASIFIMLVIIKIYQKGQHPIFHQRLDIQDWSPISKSCRQRILSPKSVTIGITVQVQGATIGCLRKISYVSRLKS